VDNAFSVSLPRALKLKRTTEYCQWMEYHSTSKDNEGREIVSYYYMKEWRRMIFPSIAFDQAFTHFNPIRDPFPSSIFTSPSASIGAYQLKYDFIDQKVNSFKPVDLKCNLIPQYSIPNDFYCLGNKYFYSPYQPSSLEMMMKFVGQGIEGTLLDFQIGDFLSHCNAGDIRVSFEVAEFHEASVIAMLQDQQGILTLYPSSNGFPVGIIRESFHTSEELFQLELQDTRYHTVLMRALLYIWSIVSLLYWDDFIKTLLPAIFLTGLLSGINWMILYGPITSAVATLLLSGSCFFLFTFFYSSKDSTKSQ